MRHLRRRGNSGDAGCAIPSRTHDGGPGCPGCPTRGGHAGSTASRSSDACSARRSSPRNCASSLASELERGPGFKAGSPARDRTRFGAWGALGAGRVAHQARGCGAGLPLEELSDGPGYGCRTGHAWATGPRPGPLTTADRPEPVCDGHLRALRRLGPANAPWPVKRADPRGW